MNGRVWIFGDHINTDLIIAGRYLDNYDMSVIAAHAMEDADPTFAAAVRPGDVIVAGRNFGCGSSREQAPLVLKECGVAAVVAESFSRIFYRNSLNVGLPLLICPDVQASLRNGDEISIDLEAGTIATPDGSTFTFPPLPPQLMEIVASGGLVPYMRKRLES